jgi:hypothetical protein
MKMTNPSTIDKRLWKEIGKVDQKMHPWIVVLGVSLLGILGCFESIAIYRERSHGTPNWLTIVATVTFGIAVIAFLALYMIGRAAMAHFAPVFKMLYAETPARIRLNKENPPPIEEGERATKTLAAYTFIVLACFAAIITAYFASTSELFAVSMMLVITAICAFSASRAFAELKKSEEPLPLVSWICQFQPENHIVEIAFQMPPDFNSPPVQERIQVAAKAILRNFTVEGLQEALELGLTKDVLELKIPVFRIQILAIDKVAVPVKVEEKKKDPSIYF